MRTARLLLLSLLSLPSMAAAQVYMPAPVYAPQVQVQGRVWFHWGRRHYAPPPVYVAAPPPVYMPPPVYYAPPPPVYYAPPPPAVYYQPPAPVYAPPPSCCAAPLTLFAPRPVLPQWQARWGFGATYEGLFTVDNGNNKGMGFLGQIRYRAARHLSLELMSGYERTADSNGVLRTDVPLTFGLIIPFLGPEHMLSPYLVLAGGVNFADLKLVSSPNLQVDDSRVQALGQVGGGLELRLGKHFALNGDLRLEGRWNLNGPSDQVKTALVKVQGQPVGPIPDNTVGLRLGVGATVYF